MTPGGNDRGNFTFFSFSARLCNDDDVDVDDDNDDGYNYYDDNDVNINDDDDDVDNDCPLTRRWNLQLRKIMLSSRILSDECPTSAFSLFGQNHF